MRAVVLTKHGPPEVLRFLDPLLELIDDGTITPIIDASFGFDEAPDAHRRLTERKNVGKVVLTSY